MKKYAIRCGSRTGSTLLCELLRSTNRCGYPQEYANSDMIRQYSEQIGLPSTASWKEYRNKLFNKRSTENSVFGIKVIGTTSQMLNFEAMDIKPTHWIRLHREDKILQAVSRYKAWKTNIWHRNHKTVVPPVPYDFGKIDWCLKEIIEEETEFNDFFADKDHISINYELDLVEDPEQTVVAVLTHMGISIEDVPELKSSRIIHRDESSYRMRDQYLKQAVWADYEEWRPKT